MSERSDGIALNCIPHPEGPRVSEGSDFSEDALVRRELTQVERLSLLLRQLAEAHAGLVADVVKMGELVVMGFEGTQQALAVVDKRLGVAETRLEYLKNKLNLAQEDD